jgi:hypothetical protein
MVDAANERARRTFIGLSGDLSPAELRAELLATAHADGTED